MTPSELKEKIKDKYPYFFDRKTMQFFGDTMQNFGVRSYGDFWELYRKNPVKNHLKLSHYFDKKTFEKYYVVLYKGGYKYI